MRAKGRLDRSSLKEIKGFLVNRQYKVFIYFVSALLYIAAAVLVYYKEYYYAGALAVLGFIYFIMPEIKASKKINASINLMKESFNKEHVDYDYELLNDGIHVNNVASGGNEIINYKAFKIFDVTERFYVLKTKSGRFLVIDKKSFDQTERLNLLNFLKEKMPHLRWDKIKY